jgi:chlorite dismutase
MPDDLKRPRLYPDLPPAGKPAWCFYPMSKRRNIGANWYELPYEEREALMQGHGKTGRTFAGRVLQLITGSTGLDDFEWGVTLFAVHPDDLKDVVYRMRFDEASARYAEFGPFYTGMVASVEDVLAATVGH